MNPMKLIFQIALINCLALGALAQSDQAVATNSTTLTVKACERACETAQTAARSACREETTRCFNQATDEMNQIARERTARCDSITDATARTSCRLSALSYAISQTADIRQVCRSAGSVCLNDADHAARVCKTACSDSSRATRPDDSDLSVVSP